MLGRNKRPARDPLERTLARRLRLSSLAIWAERLTQAFWPFYCVVALFIAATLLGLWSLAPYGAHIGGLVLMGAAALVTFVLGVRNVSKPTAAEARIRLDGASPDQPVTALTDDLAAGSDDPVTSGIWRLHKQRMAAAAAQMKPAPPDLRLARSDPGALRYVATILLAAGGIAAFSAGDAPFVEALTPQRAEKPLAVVETSFEAWATPPAYTGAPPIYLTERAGQSGSIDLPWNSRITMRVYDAPGAPALSGASATGGAFTDQGQQAYETAFPLEASGDMALTIGEDTLASWSLTMIPDATPLVAFEEPPRPTLTRALQILFTAEDDYGVIKGWGEIALDDAKFEEGQTPPTHIEPIEFELPLPLTGATTELAETVIQDYTKHPWAGLPVRVVLKVEDAAGQVGETAPFKMLLPARLFTDPLAKALIEQRRDMAWSLDKAPRAHRVLQAVTAYPEDIFEDDTAYMLVRFAVRRLGYALQDERVAAELPSILDLLWQAAVRIEDGDLSDAADRLRQAQKRLEDALERDASDEEIAQLMQELREAMNQYMQEMARQAMENMRNGETPPEFSPDQQTMDQQSLQDMMDQIEEMARNGMKEQARQMLSQLQQMMENMQMGMQNQSGQQPGNQAMRELQDMIRNQQDLADETFREMQRQRGQGQGQRRNQGQQRQGQQQGQGQQPGQGQQRQGQSGQGGQNNEQGRQGQRPGETPGAPGGQPNGGGMPQDGQGDLAGRQQALREMLEALRRDLPPGMGDAAGEALDRAGRAMEGAQQDLEGANPGGAVDDQVDALDALRDGAAAIGEEMRQQAGQQQGQGQPGQANQDQRSNQADPFGRPSANNGQTNGRTVRIPEEAERKRVRELLDEIRRRSGERLRPQRERDYLDRLLDQF